MNICRDSGMTTQARLPAYVEYLCLAQVFGTELLQDVDSKKYLDAKGIKQDCLAGVFCCGQIKDRTIFVARYTGANKDDSDSYTVFNCW